MAHRISALWIVCLAATPIWLAIGISQALAETKYTPFVSLHERYDSNVFFAPKEFIPSGSQSWDLVTSLSAGLKILNKSRLSDTALSFGAAGNLYAYNPKLAYASTNLFLASDVTDWVHELVAGLKLRMTDSFQYTPEPPAFLTGGKPDQADTFARGIQAYRANTFSNNLSVDGGYSLSRAIGLRGNYTFSIWRVGQLFVTTPGANQFSFFDTTYHTFSAGPSYTFDDGDSLYMRYSYSTALSTDTTGLSPPITYTAHTFQPEYETTLIRGWTASISGGATVVEQVGSRAFFSGRVAVSNDFDRLTRVSLAISRLAAPSFFGTAGAMISNVAQLYFSYGFSRVVRLTLSGNYAHNESAPQAVFTIETIGGVAALEYKLTRSSTVLLSQDYNHYFYTGVTPFDRYSTMLTLRTEWK